MISAGCGSNGTPASVGGPGTPVPAGPYVLTVGASDSLPAAVPITVSPADANATGGGNAGGTIPSTAGATCQSSASTCTVFPLNYAAGTLVQLTAPATTMTPALTYPAGVTPPSPPAQEIFSKWIGCQSSVGATCTVKVESNSYVEAVYIPQVTITLQASSGQQQLIGTGQQIYVTVTTQPNVSNNTYSTSIAGPSGYSGDLGTFPASTQIYQTPYPAPSYVNLTVTSDYDPVATATIQIQLGIPTPTVGPALTVDTSAVTHAISPLVYGVNYYGDAPTLLTTLPIPIVRWGGDSTTRYNYLQDVTNSAADFYFENNVNANTAYPDTSAFNSQFAMDAANGAQTMVTVPLVGYTTNRFATPTVPGAVCGMSITKYGKQQSADPSNPDCGNGETSTGYPPVNWGAPVQVGAFTVPTGWKVVTNPADTSTAIDQTFDAGWVKYLTTKFGNAANGGPTIYELDNEPEYWSGVHQDVHPQWLTYDELTNKGITYATAIKQADPTAEVGGPVISNFQNFFYSVADQWAGYNSGNCYTYDGNPADRAAHNGTPLLAYYLQQMQAASGTAGYRLLDYLDLHAYFAAQGAGLGTTAGDTARQEAREDSVRAYWDPTYIDPTNSDPNKIGNIGNNNGCPQPGYAVDIIPLMKGLVSANYPGTKTAITEYNWGGLESISGAISQAELLAIFGWQGLDLATIWGPPDPTTQVPGIMAFKFFLNYDGAGSKFGDLSLGTNSVISGTDANGNPTTSYGGSQIAIYAAKRSSDGAVTVILFNKSYQPENTSIALTDASTSAKVYQYTAGNLAAIVPLSDATVTQSSGTGTVTLTVPEQSITLLVFPQ